jgi:hypothetical protein
VIVTPDKLAVILFDGQLLLNPEIVTGDPFTVIMKAEFSEIVQLMDSLKVISINVPDDKTVAVEMVGRAMSIAELLVTDLAVNDTASFPAVS